MKRMAPLDDCGNLGPSTASFCGRNFQGWFTIIGNGAVKEPRLGKWRATKGRWQHVGL